MKEKQISIFWFRRDLRLNDNAGLYHALRSGCQVLPLFIFDSEILDELRDRKDKRVAFIRDSLVAIDKELAAAGSALTVLQGKPLECLGRLIKEHRVMAVYTNHDYEPYARERDARVLAYLEARGVPFYTYKDQVIFEKDEVVKDNGEPYTVYTPYSKKWKARLNEFFLKSYPTGKYMEALAQYTGAGIPSLAELGFQETDYYVVPAKLDNSILPGYKKNRDIPALDSTSHLSVHLRFGTVSIRELARQAAGHSEDFLNELIWREFFQAILWHFPRVVAHSFKEEYDNIRWRNNEQEFERWCQGRTGFPIVDAGMRELNETGYMHNRVRMIVASFLAKDLLVDWRWGEAYFAEKLLDYELAANNGNWQWAAGTGCDAAPYFRVFNPRLQTEKFDPELKYIRRWVPEYDTLAYPQPMVDHAAAKDRCLAAYKEALQK
ncbi:MAG: deoxyribodipyrimidine photo-lyase [Flavipsychrobacter sp.]|nr:deoxyribodipyrimidine photo-lyase [Flavipsychrobacter sp.]